MLHHWENPHGYNMFTQLWWNLQATLYKLLVKAGKRLTLLRNRAFSVAFLCHLTPLLTLENSIFIVNFHFFVNYAILLR